MTDDATMEHSVLIGVKMMMSQFAAYHPTNGVDEVLAIEIFKPVLIQVMGIRMMIKVVHQGVFNAVLVASIL